VYTRLVSIEDEIREAATKYRLDHLLGVDIAVIHNPRSKSRAVARIWGLNKIFQVVYGWGPAYVIELLAPFARLTCEQRVKTLAHELAHIPATGSGALRPHNKAFWRDYRRYSRLFGCGDFPSLQKLTLK
jgi:predicted metallopeptidase